MMLIDWLVLVSSRVSVSYLYLSSSPSSSSVYFLWLFLIPLGLFSLHFCYLSLSLN